VGLLEGSKNSYPKRKKLQLKNLPFLKRSGPSLREKRKPLYLKLLELRSLMAIQLSNQAFISGKQKPHLIRLLFC